MEKENKPEVYHHLIPPPMEEGYNKLEEKLFIEITDKTYVKFMYNLIKDDNINNWDRIPINTRYNKL